MQETPPPSNATAPIVSVLSTAAARNNDAHLGSQLLCDWTRRVYDCKDSEFIKWTVVSSTLLHLVVLGFGLWLLWYRNEGFKRSIITNAYSSFQNITEPQPLDFLVFFTTISCLMKVIGNIAQLRDMPLWFFIIFEQLYWTGITVLVWIYVFEMLSCVPVTEFKGSFAVYRHEFFAKPVYILHLTSRQRRAFLAICTTTSGIFALGTGVVEGVFDYQDQDHSADVASTVLYLGWCVLFCAKTAVGMYYGIKFTTVLRAYIVTSEAKLGTPSKPFGIKDLTSASAPRYLLVMIEISVFGGAAVFLLAGILCALWALHRSYIRRAEDERWPHLMAVTWTCANAATFLVKLTLLTFHFRRSKRRGPLDVTIYSAPQRLEYRQSRERPPAVVQRNNHMRKHSESDQNFHDNGSSADNDNSALLESDHAQCSTKGQHDIPLADVAQLAMQGRTTDGLYSTDVILSKRVMRERVSSDGACSDWSRASGLNDPASSRISLERERQVQEFRSLWQLYGSAVRLVGRLQDQYLNEEPPKRQMQHVQASKQRLQAMCVPLRQLHGYHSDYSDYDEPQEPRTPTHVSCQCGTAEISDDDYQQSDRLVLQQSLKVSVEAIIRELESHSQQP
ncbi:hypothetical protein BGZ67_008526 [Mortierella alpina]|nr:hypothetical protein BGZ67_008526 [Mortierella alpina]